MTDARRKPMGYPQVQDAHRVTVTLLVPRLVLTRVMRAQGSAPVGVTVSTDVVRAALTGTI